MTTTTAAPPLSPADRCDRCGARAIVRAVLPGGGDLLFCAHHGREHAARLREVAVEIHDDTNALGFGDTAFGDTGVGDTGFGDTGFSESSAN